MIFRRTVNPLPNNIYGVNYCNGKYTAVGDECEILISRNGRIWDAIKIDGKEDYHLNSIAYGNGVYVAIGSDGLILTSKDTKEWTPIDTGIISYFNNIAFGNDRFIIVSDDGNNMVSYDGYTWKNHPSITCYNFGIIYKNGLFIITADDFILTTNGDGWVEQLRWDYSSLYDIAYGDGVYVAVGSDGTILSSTDLHKWDNRSANIEYRGGSSNSPNDICSIAYGNGIFVAIIEGTLDNPILTSPDGINWTRRTVWNNRDLCSVTYGNGKFIAVGLQDIIMESIDGINWSIVN